MSFGELPAEIQKIIMTDTPEIIRSCYQLNTIFRDALWIEMFTQMRLTKFQTEDIQYVHRKLAIHGSISGIIDREQNVGRYIIVINNRSFTSCNFTTIVVEICFNEFDITFEEIPYGSVAEILTKYEKNPKTWNSDDVRSYYTVLNHKASRISMEPTAAKKYNSIGTDLYMNEYNAYIKTRDIVDFQFTHWIIQAYCYCIMHKYCLGIVDDSEVNKLTTLKIKLPEIQADIEYLFGEIKRGILSL